MKKLFDWIVRVFSVVALALYGLALVDFVLHPLAEDFTFKSSLFRAIVILFVVPLTLLVGYLIIRRVPGNIVGPLLIVWSVSMTFLSIRADMDPGLLALFTCFDIFGWMALFLMFLHFPDGLVYPRGASPWIYYYIGTGSLFICFMFLSWATLPQFSQVANPFSLPFLANQEELFTTAGLLLISPLLLFALISPLLRYWKGSQLERQQIKLLAAGAGLIIIYTLLGLIAYPLLTGGETMIPGNNLFGLFFYIVAGLSPPLSIGVAVLRYRLWDLDLLIRRTLVYSILTVILSIVYFGSILVLQNLFALLFNLNSSGVAIVLSTLAIATLFNPLRRRIQSDIDRRFYRQKYDAERVLAAFNTTLRDEVELNRLTQLILEAVDETMQPANVSLWLREEVRKPGLWHSIKNKTRT